MFSLSVRASLTGSHCGGFGDHVAYPTATPISSGANLRQTAIIISHRWTEYLTSQVPA